MPFINTPIADLKIFEPQVWRDERGYFYESYNQKTFEAEGLTNHWIQDNQARSTFGVLRGLHYQSGEFAQAKLVRVVLGSVFDVAVDLREDSATYGEWFGVELSDENHRQLLVPRGFAHGYVCLTEQVIFTYKCDNVYNKNAEGGVLYNDPTLNIDWQIDLSKAILSEKDVLLPHFGEHKR
jgi:dTDP-4-dehydrorhamnose 3,5-epimerase